MVPSRYGDESAGWKAAPQVAWHSMAGLVEVMRLCIYPGLTYDRPSATFLAHDVIAYRASCTKERTTGEMKRDGESPSYAKLTVESEGGGGG